MPKSTNPLLRRKSSTSSPLKRKKSTPALPDEERLDDTGIPPSLAPAGISQDVNALIHHIHSTMWTPIPERAAGMSSAQISGTLRFRASLPRIASLAHLHALSVSPTQTERELARMYARGEARKVVVPGRGKGGAVLGEGVALVKDWKACVRECEGVGREVREKYFALLEKDAVSNAIWTGGLEDEEVRVLVAAGFLVNPAASLANMNNLFTPPGQSSLALSGSKAATGTLAAVGGQGALHESGGGGSALATSSTRFPLSPNKNARHMTPSLPSTGAYLKLLTAARLHLLDLLKQTSPRFREATRDFLREKWDGNVPNDAASRAKRARGEWSGVLPGKTRKWRDFHGLEFEWVLAEAVGSGVVEVFETGSVGVGVRGV